jgi:hypothetical protein
MISINGYELTRRLGGVDVYVKEEDITLPIRHKDIEKFYKKQNLDRLFSLVHQEMLNYQVAVMEYEERKLHRETYKILFKETEHDYLKNAREFTLGTLQLLKKVCEQKVDYQILFLVQSIMKLIQSDSIFNDQAFLESYILDSQFAKYEYLHDQKAKELVIHYKDMPTLHAGERMMVRQIAESIMLEFATLKEESSPDYDAVGMYIDAAYKTIINSQIPENAVPYHLELIHNKDHLVDLKVTYEDIEYAQDRINNGSVMRISLQAMNKLHNEYQILLYKYKYLSDETKRKLVAVLTAEKEYSDSQDLFPYSLYTFSMLAVIERELGDIINAVEERKDQFTLYNIVKYMQEKPLKQFADEHTYSDYVNTIEKLRSIRNDSAHGSEISQERYKEVKKFIFNSGILNSISLYKKKSGFHTD